MEREPDLRTSQDCWLFFCVLSSLVTIYLPLHVQYAMPVTLWMKNKKYLGVGGSRYILQALLTFISVIIFQCIRCLLLRILNHKFDDVWSFTENNFLWGKWEILNFLYLFEIKANNCVLKYSSKILYKIGNIDKIFENIRTTCIKYPLSIEQTSLIRENKQYYKKYFEIRMPTFFWIHS